MSANKRVLISKSSKLKSNPKPKPSQPSQNQQILSNMNMEKSNSKAILAKKLDSTATATAAAAGIDMDTGSKSVDDLRQEGIEAYRRKEFEVALGCFSKALQLEHSQTQRRSSSSSYKPSHLDKRYELLNLRAAAYEKIPGKLEDAARDAKRMIKIDETGVVGYLRAGKILGLMGRWEAALGMYKLGLERVRDVGEERKLLEGKYQKVKNKLLSMEMEAKRVDPLITLPLEMIDYIMVLTDFRTMIRCQRVCRSWCHFFRKHYYNTYRKLDFSSATTPPKEFTYNRYIELSKIPGRAPIEEIIFSRFCVPKENNYRDDKDDKKSKNIIKKFILACPYLHTVSIPEGLRPVFILPESLGTGLISISIECQIKMEGVVTLLRNCGMLKVLECLRVNDNTQGAMYRPWWFESQCRMLERLVLRKGEDMRVVMFPWQRENPDEWSTIWPQNMPNLQSLILLDWDICNILPTWDLHNFPHLHTLTLSKTTYIPPLTTTTDTATNPPPIPLCFPLLPPSITHLTLTNTPRPPHPITSLSKTLSTLIDHPLPNLHTLNLDSNQNINHLILSNRLSHFPSDHPPLRILNLSFCHCLNFENLAWLLATGACDHLEELSLSGASYFTDEVTREMGSLAWLKGIDLSWTGVTGVGLMNIVNGVGRKRAVMCEREKGVEWVNVVGCEGVGLDAIEKARKLGVNVTYIARKRVAGGGGGGLKERKVRYGY